MKIITLCGLLSAFYAIALANTGVEHDGVGVPSHLSSKSKDKHAANEDTAVQLCIFEAETVVIFLKETDLSYCSTVYVLGFCIFCS